MGRDTLDHKVVWTHTLVPKTDTDGGITVTEEENQSSSVTPPTVQGPGEKTGEVKQSRRKNKFGSAARAVPPTEVVGSSSDTPPTVQGPGEKTGEVQMEKSRRKNKFGSAARAVPPTEVVGGSVRPCTDYKALNAITETVVYPLPRMEEVLQEVAGAQFITTMDLAKGFLQIPVAKEDQHKTAFVTPHGKWEYSRLPFGLKNAPAHFQKVMDTVLS